MELVAQEFAKLSNYPIETGLIKRIKNTKPQYNLKRIQRLENLKDAFEIDESKKTDKTILLIDDICTTGSTFESIIMQLHKSQIYNITCLATASVRF